MPRRKKHGGAREGAGRKAKAANGEARTAPIPVKVSPAELAGLRARAEELDITLAALVRSALGLDGDVSAEPAKKRPTIGEELARKRPAKAKLGADTSPANVHRDSASLDSRHHLEDPKNAGTTLCGKATKVCILVARVDDSTCHLCRRAAHENQIKAERAAR